ncbi:MAG: hypothetical protein CM15mP120_23150 [Pseudomonadota bacterium]|nr:MAG: hypothetical protein CM15mP120_23150 [Pseudomonadota bacterium]
MIVVCIPIWGYLEFEGKNKLVGALVVLLMAWAVSQLSALGLGDAVGEAREFLRRWTRTHLMDMSETSPDSQQRLARLAFVGVIVLLVVIYLVRNVDRYEDLNTEFRYGELVEMVEPIQETVEAAMLSGNFKNPNFSR